MIPDSNPMENKKSAVSGNTMMFAAAAVTAAAAGAFFLAGKKGIKSRVRVQDWATKAKADILENLEGLKHVDAATYLDIVETVMRRYSKIKRDPKEILELGKELKRHWDSIISTIERNKAPKHRNKFKRRKFATSPSP